MKSFSVIIMLFLSCNIYGQERVNYIDYHKQIIVAEQQFLYYDNLNAAFEQYKKTFDKWDKPFAKDCFIALQLACMVSDTGRAIYFFQKCFEQGVEWNTVMVSPHVEVMFNSDLVYKKRIQQLYDKCRPAYLKTIDTAYRNIIVDMYEHEKRLRVKANAKDSDKQDMSEWMRVEDSNMYELIPMIKERGFPGERRIGYAYYNQINDNNKQLTLQSGRADLERIRIFLSSHVCVLFYHHRCGYQMLKDELLQAVKEGLLHPREYALVYEWSHAYFMSKHWDDDYHEYKCESDNWSKRYNFYINPMYHSTDIKLVNKHRIEIGIGSVNQDEKKRAYAKQNQLFLFFGRQNHI